MKPFTLVGVDGNAFSVMGYVVRAMRTAGMSVAQQQIYRSMAMSSDYDNLLVTSMEMIDKVNEKLKEQGKIANDYDDYYEDDYEEDF